MTLTVAKITQCQCRVEHWYNNTDREKSKHSQKTQPSATPSTTNPTRTSPQVNPGVCSERSGTNGQSHLSKVGEVTYECFLLYRSFPTCCTTCSVLQIQAVYCFRGYVTETVTQLFCLKLATYATYCISNIWTIIFNINYPSLLTKEQTVPMAARDNSKKPWRNFSASN